MLEWEAVRIERALDLLGGIDTSLKRIADAQERIAVQAELTGKDIHRLANTEFRNALLVQTRG